MKEIAISKFKATCLAVIDEVNRTGEPVRITRRGVAMAEVVPAPSPKPGRDWLDDLADTVAYMGDLVSPVSEESDWEANQ